MKFLIMISFRNLMRQKRRNTLLGISIAFGVMILVVANSFAHGISDVMFNRIVRYVAGQVSVTFYEKNRLFCQIFRDKERLLKIIHDNNHGITQIDEAVQIPARAIGNGKAETVMIIGIDTTQTLSPEAKKEVEESFKMIDGSFEDLHNTSIENPAILSTDKAKDLNVKKNDILRIRYKNIYGQDQAQRLRIVGIMQITNIFMSGVVFVELPNAKKLLGYKPWEIGSLNISVKDPKNESVEIADRIQKALTPKLAVIYAQVENKSKIEKISVFGLLNDEKLKKDILGKSGVLITRTLANKINALVGDKIKISYDRKFEGNFSKEFIITGIFEPKNSLSDNVILLNEALFYDTYYENLPKEYPNAFIPKSKKYFITNKKNP